MSSPELCRVANSSSECTGYGCFGSQTSVLSVPGSAQHEQFHSFLFEMFACMTGRLDWVVSAGGCSAGLQLVISDLSQYRFRCSVHVPLLLSAEFFNGTLVHKERERMCVCKLNFTSFNTVVLITDKNAIMARYSMISWIYMYSSPPFLPPGFQYS